MPDGVSTSSGVDIAPIAAGLRLRAAAFIVTLYGDAIVPRGGEVWIGTIIEICAKVGISESLVRTAVSRLVAADQLEGRRHGRRSYYRLTETARSDFDAAAALIYGPPDPCDWRISVLGDASDDGLAGLERSGHVRLRAGMAIGPARGAVPPGMLVFDAPPSGNHALLPDMVAHLWDLRPHADAYEALIAQFQPVVTIADQLSPAQALILRLLLVHCWRLALLRDPRLPEAALPTPWPGHAARGLFVELYSLLSPQADSHIEKSFEGLTGAAPHITGQRLERLARHNVS